MPDGEEEMLGVAQHGLGAGHHRARVLQVGGCVGGAAVFAVVAVLVGGSAVRALAADVAVRQEHLLDRIKQLLDRAARNMAAFLQAVIDGFRQFPVFHRMGGMVMVECDAKIRKVALVGNLDRLDEFFGTQAGLFRSQHDRRPVRVVGAHVVHGMTAHALCAYPDVGLHIAHQVTDMQVAIGVGQGIADQDIACRFAHCVGIPRCSRRGIIACAQ
jgi:hypothetical protein